MTDVLVVGAGAVGAACASALARAGLRMRVLALRKRRTTDVSGGHLLLQSKAPGPSLELARRSLERVHAFAAGREAELQYQRHGSLLVARSRADAEALHAHFAALREDGIPVEWLDGDAARALEPALSSQVTAASYCPLDAQVHPALLADAWLADAAARGATLDLDAQVDGFVREGGAVRGVTVRDEEWPAKAVVLAAGPWSGELAALAGVPLEVRPRRGVLLRARTDVRLATRPLLGAEYLSSKFGDDPCSVAFSFQQHPDGECLLGGSREFAGFSEEGLERVVERIAAVGTEYLPALRGVAWPERTVGFRPWTPSGLPHVGPSEVPGLYLACGFEGDGITLAAAAGEQIAALLA